MYALRRWRLPKGRRGSSSTDGGLEIFCTSLGWSDCRSAGHMQQLLADIRREPRRRGRNPRDLAALIHKVRAELFRLRNQGCELGVRTYNTCLAFFARWTLAKAAVDLVREMRQFGVEPNERTYVMLMGAVGKNGPEVVRKLMSEMKGAGFEVGTHAYNALLQSHARSHDADGAQSVLSEMRCVSVGVDFRTLGVAVGACAGRPTAAVSIFDSITARRVVADKVSWSALLSAHTADAAACEGLLGRVRAHRIVPDAGLWNSLLVAHNRARDFDSLERTTGEMHAAGISPTGFTFCVFVSACCVLAEKEPERALQLGFAALSKRDALDSRPCSDPVMFA
eukprot:Hpha_TRINITY_DN23669_c0_g1::TRINITY_DN23669_c0_g1_i1::g.57658::m.57658